MPLLQIQYLTLKIQKPQLKGLTEDQEKIEKNKFSTISLLKNRFPFLYFYQSVFFIIKSKLIYLMEIKTEQIESYAQTNFTITPKQNKTKKFQRQPWTIIENKLYIKFLRDNLQTFKNAEERRNSKVFKKMEASIQSRSARQIKSHHQKLMIKYNKSIESIIVQVEKEMRLTQYGTALDRRMVAPRLFIDPIMQNNQFLAYEDFVIPSFHTQSLLDKLLCIDSNYEYPCEAQNLSNS